MKSAYGFKLFLVIVLGVLSGQGITRDYEKWHALGRQAFLVYQENRFDRYMAHPGPGALRVLSLTILLVAVAALYEGLAFAGAKCVSLIVATIRER